MSSNSPALAWLREDWQRVLCIFAHPDDIEYGAASAVARWTDQKKEVSYLLVTRGEAGIDAIPPAEAGPLREREQRAGAAEVGVEQVEFLDFPDGVIEYGVPLRRALTRAIRRYQPDVLVSGTFDTRIAGRSPNQADHRAVGLAVLDAAQDAGNRWIFSEQLKEEGLKPWSGVRFAAFAGAPQRTHGVDVTGYLDRGIAALQAHGAYLGGLGAKSIDPAEFLSEIAAVHGERMNVTHAVVFDVFELMPGSATESEG
ncbi:PIG-L deacetylase family protein [Streptomyces sp. BK205]|uniref:PIG-L deacetylase family protein n=1 Tax=Streptomyces sp. BK205 TaxID=2512164 RepID=UPI0010465042|nr:PIG-L deacetylase family protein [Streptomyces sp. BK205]TCR16048.1 LmbE family N-acetylglucosaminyl deacetylase [Streptomyces sp. BK205]